MFVHLQMEQLGKGGGGGGRRKGETVQKRARNTGGLRASSGGGEHKRGMLNINCVRYRYPPNRAPPNTPSPGRGISALSVILIFNCLICDRCREDEALEVLDLWGFGPWEGHGGGRRD